MDKFCPLHKQTQKNEWNFWHLGTEIVITAGIYEETTETPPSSRAEGLLFLHGLESNPGSSLQTEEEAGLP